MSARAITARLATAEGQARLARCQALLLRRVLEEAAFAALRAKTEREEAAEVKQARKVSDLAIRLDTEASDLAYWAAQRE